MLYLTKYEEQARNAREYLERLIKKGVPVIVKHKRKLASDSQLGYAYLLFKWWGYEMGYTQEEVKQDIFKRLYCRDIFRKVGKNGVVVYRSIMDLDSKELTIAIEQFRNIAMTKDNIYLPEPNEDEKLESMRAQLQQFGAAQYL